MKLVVAERARQDIAEIYDWLAARNGQAADRVEAYIRATCDRIAEHPFAAPATDEPGVRRWPLVHYPYAIFYRVNMDLDRVEIARVVHGARLTSLARLPDD